jgi:hypothetical protein
MTYVLRIFQTRRLFFAIIGLLIFSWAGNSHRPKMERRPSGGPEGTETSGGGGATLLLSSAGVDEALEEISKFLLKGDPTLVATFISGPYLRIIQKIQPENKPVGPIGRKALEEILRSNQNLNRLSLDEQNFLIVFTDLFEGEDIFASATSSSPKSEDSFQRIRQLLSMIGKDFVNSKKISILGYRNLYLNISSQLLLEIAKLHYQSQQIEQISLPAGYYSSKPDGDVSLLPSHATLSFHKEFLSFLKDKMAYGSSFIGIKPSLILVLNDLTAAIEKDYDRASCNWQLKALKNQLMPFFPSVESFLKAEEAQIQLYSLSRRLQFLTCEQKRMDSPIVAQIRSLISQL